LPPVSQPFRRQQAGADEFTGPLSIRSRAVRLQKVSGQAALQEEPVMQYILLIYENEAEAKARNPEEGKKIFAEYGAFTGAIKQSGHMRGGEPLQPTSTATTVRVKGGSCSTAWRRSKSYEPTNPSSRRARSCSGGSVGSKQPCRITNAASSLPRTSPKSATWRDGSPKPAAEAETRPTPDQARYRQAATLVA
jgi:hypothetical protein